MLRQFASLRDKYKLTVFIAFPYDFVSKRKVGKKTQNFAIVQKYYTVKSRDSSFQKAEDNKDNRNYFC